MKNSMTRKLLYNNNFLRIFSLALAILFWFVVVVNVSTDYKRTLYGVGINIEENTQAMTTVGLHVVDKSANSVNITVSGPRNLIGGLTSKSFSVTPDLGVISKAGTYELRLNATLVSPDNRIKITKISPSYISVKFDTLQVKKLPVTVKVEDNKIPDGFIMQTAESNPKTVSVSGPTSELSKVAGAQVNVKIADNTRKTTVVSTKIVLVDSNGNSLNLSHIQMSSSTAKITVPILKTKTVPIKVSFSNVPDGFDKNNISYTVSPETILVAGDEDKIDSFTSMNLGEIDFTKLGITSTQKMDIPNVDGIMNVENVQTANVSITLNNIATKVMSTNQFSTVNCPSGYKVKVMTKQINGIKLFGPSQDINNVTAVTAVVNVSAVQSGTGQYELPVEFSVPGKTGYWVTGTYSAVVNISKS